MLGGQQNGLPILLQPSTLHSDLSSASKTNISRGGEAYSSLLCASNAEGSTGLPFLTCSNIAKTVNNQTPLLALGAMPITGGVFVDAPIEVLTNSPPCQSFAIQAGALRTNPNSGPDGVGVQSDIAYTLEARAEVQAVCFSSKDNGADAMVELAPTMRAMGHQGSHANGGGQLAVCITGDITHTLKAEGFDASEDGTGRGQPIVAAFAENTRAEVRYEGGDGSRTGALSTGGGKPGQGTPTVQVGMAVRRLTPRECERLQGFPDDYTLVPVRGKPAADGPRYKAIGNSMAVPVMAWIGQRIQMAEDLK